MVLEHVHEYYPLNTNFQPCITISITPPNMIMRNMENNVNGMRKSCHVATLLTISEGMRVIPMTLCIMDMYVPNHHEMYSYGLIKNNEINMYNFTPTI